MTLPQTDRDVHWLVKDFDVLYRAAEDVSESIVDPDRETPPQRFLRVQLYRLRPVMRIIESMKAQLRGTGHADAPIYWRGSVTDLVTDLAPLLTPEQLAELAGEAAIAWKKAR